MSVGFTDVSFLFIFMPAAIILYLFTEKIFHKDWINNLLLSVLSLGFYFCISRKTLLVFVGIVLFSYLSGRIINAGKKKRSILTLTVVCLLGVLVFYKYAAYAVEQIRRFVSFDTSFFESLIIPLGLSFIVFEAISYVADIYRGDAETGSLLDCLTYLSFFPKLVSGPIVLWKDYRSQLRNRRTNWDQVLSGIDRIIIGIAKKVILADTFGAQNELINNSITGTGVDVPTIWIRALLYFFQLYFDFSGYSDIAIGISRIFGFDIKENFRYPYLSKSVTEFWRKWHISLGTWFREYVYIPLGGNRKGNVFIHLAIVFLLTGIWHGAGFCFLAWGALHGLCVIAERAIQEKNWYKKTPGAIKWLFTMAVILFGWILFVSSSLQHAAKAVAGMFVPSSLNPTMTWQYFLNRKIIILLAIGILGQLAGLEKIQNRVKPLLERPGGMVFSRICLLLLFAVDILFVINTSYSPFLYFQF